MLVKWSNDDLMLLYISLVEKRKPMGQIIQCRKSLNKRPMDRITNLKSSNVKLYQYNGSKNLKKEGKTKKLESPASRKNILCQVWLKLAQCFWRRI